MRRVLAIGAIGSLLLLGACSSDDDKSDDADTGSDTATDEIERLSLDEFLEQGNEICADGNAEIDAAGAELFTDEEPEPDVIASFVDVLVPSVQGQIDGIEALTPPEDIEEDVDAMLADAQVALDAMEEQAVDDPESVFSEEDPFADVNAQAVEIGLTECADDDGDSEEGEGEDVAADIVPDPDNPYCALEAEIDAIFEEGFSTLDPEATSEEQLEVFTAISQEVIDAGYLAQVEELAPEEIAADLEVLVAAVEDAAAGDPEAFTSAETDDAGSRVDAFCGL